MAKDKLPIKDYLVDEADLKTIQDTLREFYTQIPIAYFQLFRLERETTQKAVGEGVENQKDEIRGKLKKLKAYIGELEAALGSQEGQSGQ